LPAGPWRAGRRATLMVLLIAFGMEIGRLMADPPAS
jgi:hypothetical protein